MFLNACRMKKKVHKQSSLTPALQRFALVNQRNWGQSRWQQGEPREQQWLPLLPMQTMQARLGSDPGRWHTSLNTPHQNFFSFSTVTCQYHPTVRSWQRKLRQMASQTLPHPKGFKSLCFSGNRLHFHSPAGNKEEHDIYHLILPWLRPMTAQVQGQSPFFYPLQKGNVCWGVLHHQRVLFPPHTFPLIFHQPFHDFSSFVQNTSQPVSASYTKCTAMPGLAGVISRKSWILHQMADRVSQLLAVGEAEEWQPDTAIRKHFFAPQNTCLTICRVPRPYGRYAVRRNKLQEGSREHYFRWWAGFLQEILTSLPLAFLALMLAVAKTRGSWRSVAGSSYMFLR